MFHCFRCKKEVSIEDLIIGGTVGNGNALFCSECTKKCEETKKELREKIHDTGDMTERYINLVSWGIDPAGVMHPVYFDNTMLLKRRTL